MAIPEALETWLESPPELVPGLVTVRSLIDATEAAGLIYSTELRDEVDAEMKARGGRLGTHSLPRGVPAPPGVKRVVYGWKFGGRSRRSSLEFLWKVRAEGRELS